MSASFDTNRFYQQSSFFSHCLFYTSSKCTNNEFFDINRIIAFSLTNFNCTLTVLCSFFIPFCFDVAFLWPHRKSRYSSSCYLVSFLVLLIKEFTSMSTELYFVTQWSISIISALLCLTRCLLLTITLHPPKRCSFDSFIPFCTSQSTLSHLVGPLVIFDAYILTICFNINCTSGFTLVNFVLYYFIIAHHSTPLSFFFLYLSPCLFPVFLSSIFSNWCSPLKIFYFLFS